MQTASRQRSQSAKTGAGAYPDSKEVMRDEPWDLMLCGHLTAGNCAYRWLVNLLPLSKITLRRRIKCLWRKTHLHNPWLGSLYGLRLNCRPEVTMLELCRS